MVFSLGARWRETFNLNYRLKFFLPFPLSQQESQKQQQATQRISINYPRLRFPRSQAVLKEGGGEGQGDWLCVRRWGKRSPWRAMQTWLEGGWAHCFQFNLRWQISKYTSQGVSNSDQSVKKNWGNMYGFFRYHSNLILRKTFATEVCSLNVK